MAQTSNAPMRKEKSRRLRTWPNRVPPARDRVR